MFKLKELTNKQYHEEKEHISSSSLKSIYSKGLWYWEQTKYENKSSTALDFGSAVHKYILEKDDFDSEFIVIPKLDMRNKENKIKMSELQLDAEVNNKTIINESDMQTIELMADSLEEYLSSCDNYLFEIITKAKVEQSYFGEVDGVKVKIRYDWYNPYFNIGVDLKTTQDASENSFRYDIRKYNYDLQHAHYTKFADDLLFIAIEKTFPFNVQAYILSDSTKEYGINKWNEAMSEFKNYNEMGVAPRNTKLISI